MATLIGYAVIIYVIYLIGFKKGKKKSEVTVKVEPERREIKEEKPIDAIIVNGKKYELTEKE